MSDLFAIHRPSTIRLLLTVMFFGVVLMFPDLALAEGEALPYEKGLGQFQKSLEGPVPFAISLVGIVACGAMLIFGGEISGFMRTMLFIVLVVAVIVQASSLVSLLGGTGSLGGSGNTGRLAEAIVRVVGAA